MGADSCTAEVRGRLGVTQRQRDVAVVALAVDEDKDRIAFVFSGLFGSLCKKPGYWQGRKFPDPRYGARHRRADLSAAMLPGSTVTTTPSIFLPTLNQVRVCPSIAANVSPKRGLVIYP